MSRYETFWIPHDLFFFSATASYRLLPEIKIVKPCQGELAARLAACFPKGVITVKSKKGEWAGTLSCRYSDQWPADVKRIREPGTIAHQNKRLPMKAILSSTTTRRPCSWSLPAWQLCVVCLLLFLVVVSSVVVASGGVGVDGASVGGICSSVSDGLSFCLFVLVVSASVLVIVSCCWWCIQVVAAAVSMSGNV